MGEARTSARRVTAKIKQDRALAMRIAGATYDQIARTPISEDDPRPLYSSRQRAHEAVSKALEALARESEGKTAELRALELARLESMQVALWPSTRPSRPVKCPECDYVLYREPDQGAVDRIVRIMERRSKYLKLDGSDETDDRMVALLEQQVSLAQQALVKAMERAGLSPAVQREVLEHAADILREADEG
jgi:hypothetical protein